MPGYEDPYPGRTGSQRVTQTCGKCAGHGRLPGVLVDAGRCWRCGGHGTVRVLVSSARAAARRHAGAAAARAAEAATMDQRRAAAAASLRQRIPGFDQAHAGETGQRHAAAAEEALIAVRDGANLDRAVDDYDWATRRRFLPRLLGPNRYPSPCAVCRRRVPAQAGHRGEAGGAYVTWCTDHVPAQTPH